MRSVRAIKADLGRYQRALDSVIDMVPAGASRSDRTWAAGCHVLMDRIDGLRAELSRAETKRKR